MMGLAAGSRKRKMCTAGEETISELRRTIEAQSERISRLEENAHDLTRKPREYGIDSSLLPNQEVTTDNHINSLPPTSRTISPNSPPIAWEGTIKDLIPISMNGMEGRAMVLTEDLIDQWGTFLNIEFKVKKFLSEWEEDKDIMESSRKRLSSPERIETTETGRLFNGIPEERLRREFNSSNARSHKVGRQIQEFEG